MHYYYIPPSHISESHSRRTFHFKEMSYLYYYYPYSMPFWRWLSLFWYVEVKIVHTAEEITTSGSFISDSHCVVCAHTRIAPALHTHQWFELNMCIMHNNHNNDMVTSIDLCVCQLSVTNNWRLHRTDSLCVRVWVWLKRRLKWECHSPRYGMHSQIT